MTTLTDLFDPELFMQMEEEGYIRITEHPSEPLLIANYSEKAQYERVWNDVTRNCRGLIFHVNNKVIARGFPKFFNLSEHDPSEIPSGEAVVSNKFDGSLGIMYSPDNNRLYPSIATRGSFKSDQALHATNRLAEIMETLDEETQRYLTGDFSNPFVTYLFEVIYAENRIVVDYSGEDRLVLLDVVDNATGKSHLDLFNDIPWPDKAYRATYTQGIPSDLMEQIPKGNEGFVLYWPENGFRVKVKSEEYVNLHRIVTGLSEKSVWEMLGNGMRPSEIKENVPDELFDWVDETIRHLIDKASAIVDEAYEAFDAVWAMVDADAVSLPLEDLDRSQRATFARHAAKFPDLRKYLFKIYDRADHDVIWDIAWKQIKPVGDTRVWNKNGDGND